MVWYQMESLKDFVKLYGRINGTLKKGQTYTITVVDHYDAEKLGNEKSIFLSETGTFGAKNFVLFYFFATGAGISALVLLFFVGAYFMMYRGRRFES